MKAKKVETCFALCFFERMYDAGFLLAQLQSDALQPFLRQVATLLDNASVPVEDDQIIGIPDYLGLPVELTAGLFRISSRPGWESGTDVRFESVQIGSKDGALLHCWSTSPPSALRTGRATRRCTQLAGNLFT
jgi:hypothetical protein